MDHKGPGLTHWSPPWTLICLSWPRRKRKKKEEKSFFIGDDVRLRTRLSTVSTTCRNKSRGYWEGLGLWLAWNNAAVGRRLMSASKRPHYSCCKRVASSNPRGGLHQCDEQAGALFDFVASPTPSPFVSRHPKGIELTEGSDVDLCPVSTVIEKGEVRSLCYQL